ncbi:hypothetical protein C2S51_026927 [Perilla frutescens var. frutescens]|nr:hypothetical protein C2S51_026927 [Perilla frutescens var. frutescens]
MLLALAVLAIRLEGGGALPVVHFINAASRNNPAPINLQIKAGGKWRGSPQLSPGQDYGIRVEVDDVYFVIAVFGLRFTEFHAYEPARDKGRAAVYWRADNGGFAISHDKTHWKLVATWESE